MCSLKEIYFIHINKIKGYLLIGFSRVMETSQSVCVIRIKRLFTGLYFALCFFYKRPVRRRFSRMGTLLCAVCLCFHYMIVLIILKFRMNAG